ncbi:MAG: hypothetical protein H7145_12955 [Akkermansiaceae bacterium]|nr:hypothetical protein [Armatimonadota bacterium]
MQAVRSADQGTLSPKEQAGWLQIVDELGAKRQLLAVPKSVENGLRSDAAIEFLCRLWEIEEQDRGRRNRWLLPLTTASLGALSVAPLLMVLFMLAIGMEAPNYAPAIFCVAHSLLFLVIGFKAKKEHRQRSLAFLLTNGPIVPPAAVLIEALQFGGFGQDAKSRLVTSLPLYQDSDLPTFNEHQNRTLFSELKGGLMRRMKSGRSYFTDTDIAFLAVLIRWFEREAMYGKPVQTEVKSLLSRFARSNPRPDPSARWRVVQTAAENYLLRVGGLGSSGRDAARGNPAD